MKMKIYLRTKGSIAEMRDAYIKVFNAKVIRSSFLNIQDDDMNRESGEPTISFINLSLYEKFTVLIARYGADMPTHGYNGDIIFRMDKEEFINTYERMKESSDFNVSYEPRAYDWGTTITKFYDRWGNGWVLES